MELENGPKTESHSGVVFDRSSVESSQRELSTENEELKQKIKMLEEENAQLRGELEVPKMNESSATTPTHQMIAPTAQKMDREKENSKSDTCCCFICCISDDSSRDNNGDCCCCCREGCCCCECGGGGSDSGCCEGGCDD
jgi:hypothetical protein